MTKDEALKLALEALEGLFGTAEQFEGGGVAVWRLGGSHQPKQAIAAIKKALAQPEQEQEHAEQMSRLGWQCFNCPVCGSEGAMGYAEGFNDGCKPKPEQEPVAFINVEKRSLEWVKPISWHTPTTVNLPNIPLYTTPPQRTWVGLTDEERMDILLNLNWEKKLSHMDTALAIEAKLKEKNT